MIRTDITRLANIYFFLIVLLIPLSLILGPAISLFNIVLISISSLILLVYLRDFNFLKKKEFILLGFLYLYLVFNLFISLDYSFSVERNLGFIRFILLFLFINFLFKKNDKYKKILNYWTVLLIIICLDIFVEYNLGRNILGFGGAHSYGNRIVSFFKDEPIAGAFVYGFAFISIGHLLNRYSKDIKNPVILIFPFVFLVAIILTGERSNTIKFIIGFLFFFLLSDLFRRKTKIIFLLAFTIIIFFILNQSSYLKERYFGAFTGTEKISYKQKIINHYNKNIYFKIYKSGFNVFKNYPLFGVGNKNYRVETCKLRSEIDTYYYCTTHPHQIYIEFLSEHGFLGTIILLSILFYLIFRILAVIIKSRNYVQLGCFIYLVTNFIPFLPSGAFFGDFNSTIFWTNFSLMYACNKKTNIFQSS